MRKSEISRKTKEVDIIANLNIDGKGDVKITTPIEPLNHLLTLFAFHGLFDLEFNAQGDLSHHIIEDMGIVLGKCFKEALNNKEGIKRYGCFTIVMDKTVIECALDISGRPSYNLCVLLKDEEKFLNFIEHNYFDDTKFSYKDGEDFLRSFVQHSGISLSFIVKSFPEDIHHLLEACFKALGKALDIATSIDGRRQGIPSTKGIID